MKQIIKKILVGSGILISVAFAIVLLFVLSPIIIGMISVSLYERLWAWLRHDPKRDLAIEGFISDEWPAAETGEEFTREFEKLSDRITEMSKAVAGEIEHKGFSIFNGPRPKTDWTTMGLSQMLRTEHAEVTLSFDFGAYYSEHQGKIIVGTEDGDNQDGAGFPPVVMHVTKPKFHIARSFTIRAYEDVWMVIGILRGKEKFTQKEGQLWSYIPEHKVWIVQYKLNKSDYGLRTEFSGKVAHKYSRDD
jgi:hypothetical protein